MAQWNKLFFSREPNELQSRPTNHWHCEKKLKHVLCNSSFVVIIFCGGTGLDIGNYVGTLREWLLEGTYKFVMKISTIYFPREKGSARRIDAPSRDALPPLRLWPWGCGPPRIGAPEGHHT